MGSVPLLKRSAENVWRPRDHDELSDALGAYFGLPVDVESRTAGLAALAHKLNEGAVAHAQLIMLHLQFPVPPMLAKGVVPRDERIRLIRELSWSKLLKTWDPDQHPRWPAGAPESQGGQFTSIDLDAGPRSGSGPPDYGEFDVAASAPTIRRAWERLNGQQWPKDPKTGWNQDVAHIRARADGGSDEASNIRPLPRDEHIREHQENGDSKRWARRRWSVFRDKPGSASRAARTGSAPEEILPQIPDTAGPSADGEVRPEVLMEEVPIMLPE